MGLRDSSNAIRLVAGDNYPNIPVPLTDHETGAAIDLTSMVSAVLRFRRKGSSTSVDVPCSVNGAPTLGTILIAWGTTLVGLTAGDYEGEVKMTFPTSKQQTVYKTLNFYVRASF